MSGEVFLLKVNIMTKIKECETNLKIMQSIMESNNEKKIQTILVKWKRNILTLHNLGEILDNINKQLRYT